MNRQPPEPGATLNQWLSYLEVLHTSEIELGLDRVLTVHRRLFPGPPGARIVTVAGTNGKGTTIAALEAMLRAAGRTVAVYTSPHLQRFTERMRVNGLEVSDGELVNVLESVEKARRRTSLTYFEFTTLAAFVLFERSGAQDWLLEVGLGGRLDAVNVLDPDLAIITTIALDHEVFLGTDREVIGFEKAGILRPGRPAVLADADPPRSVVQQARAQGVPLRRINVDFHVTGESGPKTVRGASDEQSVFLPEGGLPEASLAAAVQAVWLLEPELGSTAITTALAQLRVPGRFEQVGTSPTVLIDVGHNPHAAQWLCQRLAAIAGTGRLYGVYAGLADKDTVGVLKALAGVISQWYFAPLDVPRGLSAAQVADRALEAGLDRGAFQCCGSVPEAIDHSLQGADTEDCILVFGSFYTVAAARSHLLANP
jgi:dihydrofolate synthase/folylpolyglutamate synthase